MQTTHLRPEMYPNWQEYYWTYQYKLAEIYYIPLFENWGVPLQGMKILDVGCGDGGFTAAMAAAGADCTGVEVRDFGWDNAHDTLRFIQQDILADNAVSRLGNDYDIIVLRDVIEHIPGHDKNNFMDVLRKFLKPNGIILLTFPPFYSPFGLHQQAFLKTFFRKLPFLSWIPAGVLNMILKAAGESEPALANVRDIRDCQMTIRQFKSLVGKLNYSIENEKYYQIRPSHELRYGWKTRESKLASVPILREWLVLGSVFKLSLNPKHNERNS